MTLTLKLFGAFRDLEPAGEVSLELPAAARIADARAALDAYARAHWGEGFRPGLLAVSAFASEHDILRDADAIGEVRELALLPPVSGG
jgi:molybdopterin synthase sulfur carrier subunit